jgi:hypothetical protein
VRKEFSNILKNLLSNNNYALLLGDISVGLFIKEDETLPKNIFNVGILEQSMISFAAGLSKGGIIPFVHTISPFIVERAYEQIKLEIDYNQNKVIMVSANGPYDYNKLGPTHHCAADVPLMDLLQSINIYLPGRPEDVESCINSAIKSKNSSYIRLNSQKNSLHDIEPAIIYKKSKQTQVLNVFIGESISNSKNNLIEMNQDWIYVFDLKSLNKEIFSNYNEIVFWEPYSRPIIAHKFRKILGPDFKIVSHVYPDTIHQGIFEHPSYLRLNV